MDQFDTAELYYNVLTNLPEAEGLIHFVKLINRLSELIYLLQITVRLCKKNKIVLFGCMCITIL